MQRHPSERLLRLLTLLQGHREWSSAALADRLGITPRTVRRDVERLRHLGYTIEATAGRVGGYRMPSSQHLPPLLFEPEEATVIALSLLMTATSEPGLKDAVLSTLAKLHPLLPDDAQRRVSALLNHTRPLEDGAPVSIDLTTLGLLSASCREHEFIRFAYRKGSGELSQRRAEPYQLVSVYRYWYLVAFDTDAQDWRSFRLDRMTDVTSARQRFIQRPLPSADALTFVLEGIRQGQYPYQGHLIVHETATVMTERLYGVLAGNIQPLGADKCSVTFGSHSIHHVLRLLVMLDAEFELVATPEVQAELGQAIQKLGHRLNKTLS